MRLLLADRLAGVILLVVGSVAVFESIRLYPFHIGRSLVGDETFIGFLGVALIIMGGLFIFVFKPEKDTQVEFPTGEMRKKMFLVVGLLFAYWALLELIGYPASTFIIGMGLFRVVGGYGWLRCVAFTILLSIATYGIFMVWLSTPFPQPQIEIFNGW